jgi:hypothetical protein
MDQHFLKLFWKSGRSSKVSGMWWWWWKVPLANDFLLGAIFSTGIVLRLFVFILSSCQRAPTAKRKDNCWPGDAPWKKTEIKISATVFSLFFFFREKKRRLHKRKTIIHRRFSIFQKRVRNIYF